MEGMIIILLFFILMGIGIPVAVSLGVAAAIYIIGFVDLPAIIIVQQMISGVDKFTLLAIPFFMMAGSLMEQGGISARIVDFSKKVLGPVPGGLALVTILASMIFAAMTGAGAATVAAIGAIIFPQMIKEGYDEDFTCALMATGGIFGPLIPPSILMVLYGVATDVSVGDMLIGGVMPGIIMGVVVAITALIMCKKNGIKAGDRYSGKEIFKSFISAFWALLTPVIILGGIYSGIFSPTEAAAVATLYSLIIGMFVYRELKISNLVNVLFKSMKTTAGVLLIVATTQAFGWVLTKEQIPQLIANWFTSVSSSPLVFLFAVSILLLIAGCFLDPVPAVMIFAPILFPASKMFSIDPVHFGVVMVVALCIGLITPPVGINLFVASSVGDRPVHKIVPHIVPFLYAVLVGLLAIILVPAFSTFLPSLL
ncbi:MAG: C4-dicarboxylate ABC transporter substrate-binding protein [Candidatus Epulonipiscium fishelsonii]|nr:MAG: C4-dicarboxylate ABC transporter substrate-binding protein [Epulopiscium sp. AS2M-Bin002]